MWLFPCRSSHSAGSASNKYESRERINAAAQRTLLADTVSEADGDVYEGYAAVRSPEAGQRGTHWEHGFKKKEGGGQNEKKCKGAQGEAE